MRGFIAGLARAGLFFRDSNGYATGTQSTLSNGATSGAYVFDFPITAGYQPPPAINVDITGGDKRITAIQFGNAYTPPFDLAIADFDTSLITLAGNTSANTTNSFYTYVSTNPNLTSPRQVGLFFQSRYTLDDGSAYWLTTFMPSVAIRVKKSQVGFQAKADVVLACTPSMVTKAHDGRGFGTSGMNLGLEGDVTDNYDLISARPIHLTTFKSDAAATTFSTTYKPISTVVTNNATPNQMLKNATATALTSITLAGLATLAAAGTAADVHILLYQTDYVLI